jgi:Flp pilus assembly protein TadD
VIWLAAVLALGSCATREQVSEAAATYVGREACAGCHADEARAWEGSDHDLAMQEASEKTVLGDFAGASFVYRDVTTTFTRKDGGFFVETDGPDGRLHQYEVAFTFGVDPLQQYLVPFEDGRYQALPIAWDTRPKDRDGQRWFHLYPDQRVDWRDPLHWTRRFQNWNLMCAECHSTALEKGYDPERGSYRTTWSEIDVSCEACHGPGSRHVSWARIDERDRPSDRGLIVALSDRDGGVWITDERTGLSRREPPRSDRFEVETCGRCHARRSAQQARYVHGRPILDTHRIALLDEPLYFADGQIEDEVYEYGSFLQSRMYRQGVTCKDCHDPHRLGVRGEGNSRCAACHLASRFDSKEHHHHEPGSAGASCVECHMSQRNYMVVDGRRDHSFRVPRPDLTLAIGAPNACNGCHGDKSVSWAREAVVRWYGDDVKPHFGSALDAARRALPGASARLEALAADGEMPAIARATALSMLGRAPTRNTPSVLQAALVSDDPLVRLGAIEGADLLDESSRHRMVVPSLGDAVRSVRLEAARALASVPRQLFTTEQAASLEKAIAEYRDAQLANADWPESHVNLGLLDIARGQFPEAERSYQTALKLDPLFTRAYVNLADLYRAEGRDAEGEALLRRGLENLPDDPALHHALGLALVRLKRTGDAIAEFARALELQPDEPRHAYVYGVALQSSGDVTRAVAVLTEACRRHPYDRDLLLALSTMHRDREEWTRAIEYARRLSEIAPEDRGVLQFLAELEARERRSP